MDELEAQEKKQDFQREMKKNGAHFSELLENIGTTKKNIERDRAGGNNIEGWEQLVNTTASRLIVKKVYSTKQSSEMVG